MQVTEIPSIDKSLEFQNLYRVYAPVLLRRCMQYVKQRDIAEDLTHNVFLKAMEHRDQFRNISSVYTWLYRIATNLCLNYLRDHRRELVIDEIASDTVLCDSEDDVDLPLKRVMIENLLSGFCTTTRRIVFLTMFERLSQEEIAKVLDVSRNTIQKKWNNFLQQARKRCGIAATIAKEEK